MSDDGDTAAREDDKRSKSVEDGEEDDRRSKSAHSRSRSRSRSRIRSPSVEKRRKKRRRRSSRSRSYSRSRSREHRRRRRSRHSRSRSRSRSPRGRHDRYDDRATQYIKQRHFGSRDAPSESRCLGVFGLSLYTTERDLKDFFSKFGPIENIRLIYDRPTGRSRGFGFITFENADDAVEAKEASEGVEMDGHRLRVDFSITKRAHSPTPGVYMGYKSDAPPPRGRHGDNYGGGGGGGGGGGRRRSRSASAERREPPSRYY